MSRRNSIGLIASQVLACAAAFLLSDLPSRGQAAEKYPDITGAWVRPGAAQWDPTKPSGLKQEAPLTPEYQKVFEANLAEQFSGGQEYNPQTRCLPAGTPRVMIAYQPLEIIVTPETTYIQSDHLSELRRIYTDGRSWPGKLRPSYHGYSIGKWLDEDHDGTFDVLEVETRGLKGPRTLDASGLPLHQDNQTIVKERIFLDKANRNLLHDQITTIDHAYTRPWTVTRNFDRDPKPVWIDYTCGEANNHVEIGGMLYFLSADGKLMPTRKDQAAPDLRNFQTSAK
jgi:hypothetical protein